jgi:hypothetical protein
MAMRNLVAEMPKSRPRSKASAPLVIGMAPARSRSPIGNQGRLDEFSIQRLHEMTFPIYEKFSIMISVMDELADALILTGDMEAARAASVIQGEYGCLTTEFNGRPVWKQINAAAPSEVPLYLYYVDTETDGGWYIADSIMDAGSVKNDNAERFAWMEGDGSMPGNVHLPYWKKKAITGIDVEPLVWFLGKRVVVLQSMMSKSATDAMTLTELAADGQTEAMDIVTDAEQRLAAAYVRIEELESRIEVLEADDNSGGSKPKGMDKGNDDGSDSKGSKGGTKSHGGWAPKLAKLMNVIWKKDWNHMEKLCDQFYKSDLIEMLCDEDKER